MTDLSPEGLTELEAAHATASGENAHEENGRQANTLILDATPTLLAEVRKLRQNLAQLRGAAVTALALAQPYTRTDIYERLRAHVYRGADYTSPSEVRTFSDEIADLKAELATLRSTLEKRDRELARARPILEAATELRRANNLADSISLANDRTSTPDEEAQRAADRKERQAMRAVITALDACPRDKT